MNPSSNDIVEYILALIDEFAETFGLTEHQAYRYIKNHEGIGFIEENYGIFHTLSFRESVDGLAEFCKRRGGTL